jgi:hypothetical protein
VQTVLYKEAVSEGQKLEFFRNNARISKNTIAFNSFKINKKLRLLEYYSSSFFHYVYFLNRFFALKSECLLALWMQKMPPKRFCGSGGIL